MLRAYKGMNLITWLLFQVVTAHTLAPNECKMATLVSQIFELNPCTIARSGSVLSIFIHHTSSYSFLLLSSCFLECGASLGHFRDPSALL